MRLVHVTSNNNVPGATKSTFHGNRNYETERVLESLARNNVARVDKSPWSFSLSLSSRRLPPAAAVLARTLD